MAAISWSKPAGRLAGCGGWSRRRTLVRQRRARRSGRHRARSGHATRPRFARSSFTRISPAAAWAPGCWSAASAMRWRMAFAAFEMMATLPGVRLYAARGYVGGDTVDWPLAEGLSIRFLPMRKTAPSHLRTASSRAAPADADARSSRCRNSPIESEARLYDDWNIPPLTQTLESLRDGIRRTRCAQGARRRNAASARCARRQTAGACHIGRLMVAPEHQGTRHRHPADAPHRERHSRRPARFELFTGGRSDRQYPAV